MKKACWKDIWRTISKGKKRFLSIVVIVTLGVTMMCGLRAACEDLRYSADQFFDEQNLFDIRILSTMGITEEDIEVLEDLDSVSIAEGGYNETVYTFIDEIRRSIEVCTLSSKEMNKPYLLDGRMPEKSNEIVITESYLKDSGKQIGDQIVLDEEPDTLKYQTYTITGTIINTLDINSTEGSMGFRSTATTDYVGYVSEDAVDSDIYTVLYLRLEELEALNCYTDEYSENVEQIVDEIESKIKKSREQARYDEIYGDAMDEWLDGEQKMLDEFAKADAEIADAKEELADARKELEDGKKELADGEAELNTQAANAKIQFANAWAEIHSGYAEISSGEEELSQGYAKLQDGQSQLNAAKAELQAQQSAAEAEIAIAWETIAQNESELAAGYELYEENVSIFEGTKAQLQVQIDTITVTLADENLPEEQRAELETQLAQLQGEIAAGEQQLEAVYAGLEAETEVLEAGKAELSVEESVAEEQFAAAWAEISASQAELDAGFSEYQTGVSQLANAKARLVSGEKELSIQEASAWSQIEEARGELADAKIELAEGEAKLENGEQELADSIAEYEEEKTKAEQELADALDEINEIEMTKWYVQERTTLSGYSNVKSDADSIQAIGNIFPILFLVVAVLISLTTITRMVEEERGLIGTYKALGFTNAEILRKYLFYAATACLIGGVVGDFFGYVVLPKIIFIIFGVMYTIPEYEILFDTLYGFGGILFFEVGVVGATVFACGKSLKKAPAKLMRPKSPKAGSRVFMERITFVWKRMSFLNKVTARNLFRYKKRLLMTIFGIAGCTGLLLCGFTIKDTVSEIVPQQYEVIYTYDMMVVSSEDDYELLQDTMNEDDEIEEYIATHVESVDLINDAGTKETVQLIVVPEGSSLESYIFLKNKEGQKIELTDEDVLLTRNATRILGLEKGDNVTLRTLDLEEVEITITNVVENYFGNTVYMKEAVHKEMFGEFHTNGALVHLSEFCEDQTKYSDELSREEYVLSAVSTEAMQEEFTSAFALINMVVYIILILAALLAFAVLFTLSNTNISERERELATIKVLGFFDNEVHAYVNKETWILTLIGIVAGMPIGWLLGRYVMGILEFPSLEFYIALYPQSYLFAGTITLIFALIVNTITNKSLNKINMVEALKSVE